MKHGVRWRSMRRNSTLGTSRRIQKIKNPSHHQGQSVKRKCSSALQNYSVNSRFLQTLVMSKFRTKLKSQSHQTSPNYMPSMKMSVGVPLLSLWRMKVILLLQLHRPMIQCIKRRRRARRVRKEAVRKKNKTMKNIVQILRVKWVRNRKCQNRIPMSLRQRRQLRKKKLLL